MSNEMIDGVPFLPCPFCGKEARYVPADYVDDNGKPWPFAECNPCNVGAPVEFWNKRAYQHQGEPAAWYKPHWNGKSAEWRLGAELTDAVFPEMWEPLYTEQPAPVAVAVVTATGGPHDTEDRVLVELQAELPPVGTKLYAHPVDVSTLVALLRECAAEFNTAEASNFEDEMRKKIEAALGVKP